MILGIITWFLWRICCYWRRSWRSQSLVRHFWGSL